MTSRKITLIVFILIVAVGAVLVVKNNIGPIVVPPKDDVVSDANNDAPASSNPLLSKLTLPAGFEISIFAKDIPGARVMVFDTKGRMIVSQTEEGKIAIVETDGTHRTLLGHLDKPHGLAFKCDENNCLLYVAEHGKLSQYAYAAGAGTASEAKKLLDLSSSSTDRHFTRTLLFLPYSTQNTLLISVGSSCNVCNEKSTMQGKIMAYNIDTGKVEEYAKGLRNSVFMALNPVDGQVFATEMGRDGLGDTVPPDEVNVIKKGANYGWPICYGKNIHDTSFDKNTYIRNPCLEPLETQSFIDIPAHSAPLGLSFIPEEGWDENYWYDLLVAYHGSWNSSVPTGYKIVRMKIDAQGKYSGTEDFITGWLTADGTKIGRPVDIQVQPGGVIYISDDLNGMIYKVSKKS